MRSVRKRLMWAMLSICWMKRGTFERKTEELWSTIKFMLMRWVRISTNAALKSKLQQWRHIRTHRVAIKQEIQDGCISRVEVSSDSGENESARVDRL